MRKNLLAMAACAGMLAASPGVSSAQINLLQDYKNNNSAAIGVFQGINFREAGFSGLYPIPGTNGKEFWTCSDRGANVDAANANPSTCRPTYDKIYGFPNYAPKIHRIRLNGDSVQILQTITMKRPNGTTATGVLNPTGFGSTATEEASTDTVLNCANFASKIAPKDIWGIDAEAIVVDRDGFFWISEEGGPTIWKLNRNGVVIKRYTPYANLTGAQSIDVAIDTVFKYRKNNRGFESLTIAPNGRIYALIQSPLLYPTAAIGEATRVHRMLEINPANDATRMMVYLNDGIVNTGANQVRLRDWKIGDMAAINDSTFLVLEAAARGTTDLKRVYKINITGATAVTSGQAVETMADSAGLAANSIVPVKKTLFMDLLANGWPAALDKAEGIAIVNDSTIFIGNDNDYGQFSPLENGIATATTNLSHVIKYGLKGANKLSNYAAPISPLSQGLTGPSTSSTPYLTPFAPGVSFTSIITAGETVNGYKMVGLPDGLGAYDNNNGTFTLLVNHELGNTSGVARAHGSTGAFVSKWVINKADLSVVSGGDLMQRINLWNPLTSSYTTYNSQFPSASAALTRFCSANLPAVSAYYNSTTGKGTMERIFMDGEESGNEGRGFGHIATGPNAGTSYELPALGKFSWENAVACPASGDTTIVVGLDDATPGQIYVYVGSKTTSGTDIEKAGLTNGKLYGVSVTGMLTETSASIPAANTAFTLANLGNVQNMTGTALNTASDNAGVTRFLRPEDGDWDPANPNDFYFATTNAFSTAIPSTSPSRLWRLRFTNISNPSLGGTITAVLDGTEGQQMLDNIGPDNYGHIVMVEDVGGNAHIGKVWQYDIATDAMTQIARHDTTRFLTGSPNFLTQDEEATGPIDVQHILGPGMFIIADQAHYGISGEVVEGGQLLAMYNPASALSNPEVTVQGNNVIITDGATNPVATNNTDLGNTNTGTQITKTFTIMNDGPGSLTIRGINITGAQAGEFTLVTPPVFPLVVAANASQTITVRFAPTATGARNASITIVSNDFDEAAYDFALRGTGTTPELNVQGNSINIADGDLTAGLANNTDFGTVNLTANTSRTFALQNSGTGPLTISGMSISGVHQTDFTVTSPAAFPVVIAPNSTVNFIVRFAPTASGIRNAVVNVASDDADENNYDFAVQGIGRDATSINNLNGAASFAKLYPNPTGDAATVSITLKKADHIIVTVAGIDGKEVMRAADQNYGIGEQQIMLNTSALANGTYFVQIATGSQVTKIKMVVAH